LSSDRETLKAAFLAAHGFGDARRVSLGGDASTRSYERLHRGDESFIFMDQPPSVETAPCPPDATPEQRAALGYNALARLAAGLVDAFVACAGWLKAQGLSAPAVLAADPAAGLAVLEDLGDDLYAPAGQHDGHQGAAEGEDEGTAAGAADLRAPLPPMGPGEQPSLLTGPSRGGPGW